VSFDLSRHSLTSSKITEVEEPKVATKKAAAAPVENKKRKAEVIDSPAPATAAGDVSVEGLSKAQQKKLAKKARRESEGSTAAPAAAEKKAEKVPEKKAAPAQEKKQKVRK
jgi:FK506-binding nuclear protein